MLAAIAPKTTLSVVLLLALTLVIACGGAAPQEQAAPQAPQDSQSSQSSQDQQTAATTAPGAEPTVASTPFATAEPTVPPQVQADTPRLMLKAPEDNPKRGGAMQWAGLSDSPHFDMHQCNTAACAQPQGPYFDNLLRYSPFDGVERSSQTWATHGKSPTTVSFTLSICATACYSTTAPS
jgi:hypothetical protein